MGDGALQNNIKWGGIDGVKIVKIRWVKNVLLARTNNFYEGNKIEWKDKFSM